MYKPAEPWPSAVLRGAESRQGYCARVDVSESEYASLENRYLESKLPERILDSARSLKNGAKVIRDRYGIPHIFAPDDLELEFATGLVQAQDRLWQLDYRRRLARGTLAEVLGESALRSDMEIAHDRLTSGR